MMDIYYETSQKRIIHLDRQPYYLLEDTTLFDTDREYTQTGNAITSVQFREKLKERDLDVMICGTSRSDHDSKVNALINAVELDVVTNAPGRLYVGDYYIKCYLYKSKKPDRYINAQKSVLSFTLIYGKNLWIKETRKEYIWTENIDTEGRGYAYGYDYDYTMGSGNVAKIRNTHFASCNFVLKISGYAKNPMVTIGDHVYRIMETVQKNEILTIDTRNKTIVLTKNNGVQVNCYSKRDKSSYIFEPIPAGEQRLYWNAAFNLEITLYEERSEPLWM